MWQNMTTYQHYYEDESCYNVLATNVLSWLNLILSMTSCMTWHNYLTLTTSCCYCVVDHSHRQCSWWTSPWCPVLSASSPPPHWTDWSYHYGSLLPGNESPLKMPVSKHQLKKREQPVNSISQWCRTQVTGQFWSKAGLVRYAGVSLFSTWATINTLH